MNKGVEWGSVGEWVSGGATFAAVVVALWVAHREGRWRRSDSMRAAYGSASQLRLIVSLSTALGVFEMANSSDQPFRDLKVTGLYPNGQRQPAPEISLIRPGQRVTTSAMITRQPKEWAVKREDGFIAMLNYAGVSYEFRDETGRHWLALDDEVYLRVRVWLLRRWRRADGRVFKAIAPVIASADSED